jgi:anionic cell wall polymer biosynthesis LytR-Cps2A-Psr (LCP) family protein
VNGKNSLYGRADSEKPDLSMAKQQMDSSKEIVINPDDMEDISCLEEDTTESDPAENAESETAEEETIQDDAQESTTEPIETFEENFEGGDVYSYDENIMANNNSLDISQSGTSGNGYDVIYNGEKYAYNSDMINLLFLGIDKRGVVEPAADGISGGQSDALFLLAMNPHTMVMDIIAIPRDTITEIDIYDRAGNYSYSGYAQICLQHGYGDAMSVSNERAKNAVSKLFYHLPIHSVTSVNLGGIPGINDEFGGVTLESLYTFSSEGWDFVQGQTVKLQGMGAYAYVHYRDTSRHYTAGERLARQKQYMGLFMNQALDQLKKNPAKVIDVYNAVADYVVTDLGISDMTYLASEVTNYRLGGIYSLEGTVDTSRTYERYYLDDDALYQLIINEFYEKVE